MIAAGSTGKTEKDGNRGGTKSAVLWAHAQRRFYDLSDEEAES